MSLQMDKILHQGTGRWREVFVSINAGSVIRLQSVQRSTASMLPLSSASFYPFLYWTFRSDSFLINIYQTECFTSPFFIVWFYYMSYVFNDRAINAVERDETNDKKSFQEEVIRDPTLQDKLSILTRTFHNKRMVCTFLFTSVVFLWKFMVLL